MKDEEDRLVNKVKKGDLQAFEELFNMYKNLVYSRILSIIGRSNDVEDLVQETFYKTFKFIRTFNREKSKLSTWISTIAHNVAIDHIRKNSRKTEYSIDTFFSENDKLDIVDCKEPKDKVKEQEKYQFLLFCISELDKKYKVVIELRYFQDMEYKKIAETLGIPIGTVMTRLFRAKANLIKIAERYQKERYD
jgi:RNA polymerase sigma-70 factor (ECF subfamily)